MPPCEAFCIIDKLTKSSQKIKNLEKMKGFMTGIFGAKDQKDKKGKDDQEDSK